MILGAMAAGAMVGTGLVLVVRGLLAPPPPQLERRLAALYQPPAGDGVAVLRAHWHRWAHWALTATGRHRPGLGADLAVCDLSVERHATAKLSFALAGAGLPALVAVVWQAAGITVPAAGVVVVAVGCAAAGFFAPDVLLARRAARQRRDFRYALSLFLDLIVIGLAGGGGVETAVHDATGAGGGWTFGELRAALHTARLQRASPWAALHSLGDRLGSPELVELAASVELAGTTGARVRDSLRAKAASARDHELAESEADALAASERMGAPMVAMFVGLLLVIGYPAMATVVAL